MGSVRLTCVNCKGTGGSFWIAVAARPLLEPDNLDRIGEQPSDGQTNQNFDLHTQPIVRVELGAPRSIRACLTNGAFCRSTPRAADTVTCLGAFVYPTFVTEASAPTACYESGFSV